MALDVINPAFLEPNPWNTNRLSPEAELKLENSIERLGLFKPLIVRELPTGKFQILGGQHRAAAAERLGLVEVSIFNLGVISDDKAKEIGIVDNGRYGQDDSVSLAALLDSLGSASELASFMPFDIAEIDALHSISKVNLDDLGLDDENADPIEKPTRVSKTHSVMRFKIPIDDQGTMEHRIKAVIEEQGFDDSDSMINAGDALVWLILNAEKSDE